MNQPIKPPQEATPQAAPQREADPFGPPPKRSAWRLIATCLVLLLVVAAVVWWSKQQAAPEQQGRGGRNAVPMSIVPETVGKGDIGINLNALGTVTSLATVTIRSQISGYLQKVDFKEGDEVKKGDLIAEIDPRPYEAMLAQANGNLARDQALLKGAQVDLARYQGLATQNAVPHQTLDTQVALVAQDQGTVEFDKAAVKSAEVNLQYTRILSPLDGRVGLRQVDQGNYVTPGDASGIVVITQLQPISVLFTVPEDNLQPISKRLQSGAVLPAAALDRGGGKKIADGTLQTFDSQIDPTTGTIKLRAQFPNETKTLYPNQFVNIQLLLDTHKDVTTMPTAGVQRGVPGTFVYLVNSDDTVSVRKIELGVTDGDRVEVRSGLQPGDKIVVDGADKLRDGAKINVRAEAPNPNAPAAAPAPEGEKAGKKRRSEGQKQDGQKQDDGQKQ
jgi:membrane fusion protein, multidrug efflux system